MKCFIQLALVIIGCVANVYAAHDIYRAPQQQVHPTYMIVAPNAGALVDGLSGGINYYHGQEIEIQSIEAQQNGIAIIQINGNLSIPIQEEPWSTPGLTIDEVIHAYEANI